MKILPIGLVKSKNNIYIIDNNMNSFICSKSILNSVPIIPEIYYDSTINNEMLSKSIEFNFISEMYEKL